MTAIQLTKKEKTILHDQKNHEEVCIGKYERYAKEVSDPQLQRLLQAYAEQEQRHLDYITILLQGQIPGMEEGRQMDQPQGPNQQQELRPEDRRDWEHHRRDFHGQERYEDDKPTLMEIFSAQQLDGHLTPKSKNQINKQKDAAICNDLLMMEKFVSESYNTAVFEFQDSNMRQALSQIQSDEQKHGEGLYNHMLKKGMYNPL